MDFDDRVLATRVIKNALGGRRLSGVDVRDDSDVADVSKGVVRAIAKFRLDSGSWVGKTLTRRRFFEARMVVKNAGNCLREFKDGAGLGNSRKFRRVGTDESGQNTADETTPLLRR